jgi:hypothetical protein
MSTNARRHRSRAGSVSATDAAKNFGRLVNRVREERATYIVERGGTPGGGSRRRAPQSSPRQARCEAVVDRQGRRGR